MPDGTGIDRKGIAWSQRKIFPITVLPSTTSKLVVGLVNR